MLVVELTACDAFYSRLVREGEYRMFGAHRVAIPFCLCEFFVGCVTQVQLHLGLSQVVDECTCGDAVDGACSFERYQMRGNVHSVAQGQGIRKVVVELLCVCEFCFLQVAYLVVLLALEGEEHIVLVRVKIVLSILVDVILVVQSQRVYGELVGVLSLFVERILHLSHILKLFVSKAVCYEESSEQVGVQVGRGHCSRAQTCAFQCIVADAGVHGAVK